MRQEIYCDGACIPNPGLGGFAFAVYRDGVEVHEEHGGLEDTTNNVMELTGMLRSLLWLKAPGNRMFTTIYCDSQYVVKGCNEWRRSWAFRGWKTASKKPVKNLELWKEISALLDAKPKLPVSIDWIKGHAGFTGNERADQLSMLGAAETGGVTIDEIYAMERRMAAHIRGEPEMTESQRLIAEQLQGVN